MSKPENAGFTEIETVDKTSKWTTFVRTWRDDIKAKLDANAEEMGQDTANAQSAFCDTFAGLIEGGNLGGLRVIGCKPG